MGDVLRGRSTLHCRECGAALDDGQLLRGRDLCLTCEEEDERLYGPEDEDDVCPQCGETWCCEDTHGP